MIEGCYGSEFEEEGPDAGECELHGKGLGYEDDHTDSGGDGDPNQSYAFRGTAKCMLDICKNPVYRPFPIPT